MYFIARNNKVYGYIASKKPFHRYLFTGVVFVSFIFIVIYGVYYPLQAYNMLLAYKRDQLQKKYAELAGIREHNKNYEQLIEKAEKTVHNHAVRGDYAKKDALSCIIDALQQCGLHLQSYSVLKENDKEWYTKEIVHVDVIGTLGQCVSFIEYSKKAEKLLSISQLSIDCNAAICKMNCDIAYMAIKNPSTLGKLKG